MKRLFVIIAFLLAVSATASAQEADVMDQVSVGVSGGWHTNAMRFSALDKSYYPDKSNSHSGVFSVFAQYDFGNSMQFAVRPELAFLRRGGRLNNIGMPTGGYSGDITDVFYQLNAKYLDFRVPFMYSFLKSESTLRPYVALAPVMGFTRGGDIKMQQNYSDNSYEGHALKFSKANYAAAYFALELSAGVRYKVNINDIPFYMGLSAGYELGLSDTYSKMERNGEVTDVNGAQRKVSGSRKHSGFEMKASVSVPLSVFKKKKKIEPLVEEEPVYVPEPMLSDEPLVSERLYTMEEIDQMLLDGQDVTGKTIAAVDAIYFDMNKSTIKKESYAYLDHLAEILLRTGAVVEIKGHTDNTGSEEYNMRVSRDRALAVVKYLNHKGVKKENLLHSYYGMTRPIESNETEEGRRINRRVEIEFLNFD